MTDGTTINRADERAYDEAMAVLTAWMPVGVLPTLDDIRMVLWHVGDRVLGTQPGHFTERILWAVSAADEANRDKLAREWPTWVYLAVFARTTAGLDTLRTIAKVAPRGVR
jgi:hypothetical protein